MIPRFLAPDLRDDESFSLPTEEAAHASRVLRLRPGAEVLVFDGRGRQVRARLEQVDRTRVTVRPVALERAATEPAVQLTLAQAVLKTEGMDDVVRDATMMGVSTLLPVVSARSTVSLETLTNRRSVGRWRRIAVASAKQCGRAVVPEIRMPLARVMAIPGDMPALRLVLVEPSAEVQALGTVAALQAADPPDAALMAIGPEGGWDPAELAWFLGEGFVALTLGPRILRADAAALVSIAVLQFVWGDLSAARGG